MGVPLYTVFMGSLQIKTPYHCQDHADYDNGDDLVPKFVRNWEPEEVKSVPYSGYNPLFFHYWFFPEVAATFLKSN